MACPAGWSSRGASDHDRSSWARYSFWQPAQATGRAIIKSIVTLAHELGHGGHFGLAMKHQRLVNTRPAMPFVEAPSIMNEMLLAHHVLGQSNDPRMRRSIIMQVLGTFHHNFVTHLLEAELQRQIYALAESGQAITATVRTPAEITGLKALNQQVTVPPGTTRRIQN